MIVTPAFRAHLHAEVIPGEGALLLSEMAVKALYGAAYGQVVALIDGRRTADEIVASLAATLEPAKTYYILEVLQSKGHVIEATPGIARDVAAFWNGLDRDAPEALAALREKSVSIRGIGADAGALSAALDAQGIRQGEGDAADLCIVIADDYLRADLAAFNADAIRDRKPWLLVRAAGPELWVGPLFEPSKSGCWQCLRTPLERNRAGHLFATRTNQLAEPPVTAIAALPATRAIAVQMAAVAASQYLAGVPCGLAGKVLSLDWTDFSPQTHTLIRHPHCPACGVPKPAAGPVNLSSSKVNFTQDGGHRLVAPEATLKKYAQFVSPITGVVKRLEASLVDDGFAHVFMAGHNNAVKLGKLSHLKKTLRHGSSGKGKSESQAKASALCEAIERYSGEFTGTETRVTRAWRDWADGEAIHPEALMHFSDRQYRDRESLNAGGSVFNHVPRKLPDDVPIDWTPVWSLTAQRMKYLPTQFLYFSAPATAQDRREFAVGCSNGNAAGNTLEEAVMQGFFELVERDAVAMWWYNRLLKPGVAIETFGEPYLVDFADHYWKRYRRRTWALDLTSDLGIPVYVAASRLEGESSESIMFGFGCHLDARVALHRAYSEMTQLMSAAAQSAAAADTIEDHETLDWMKRATVEDQPHLAPDPGRPLARFTDHPLQHRGDALQDILTCRARIETRGMEMLVLDQTRAEVGLPVAKVIVPGLRHYWSRLGRGRLYDVPVQMGWSRTATAEADVNPVAMFF